MITAHRLTTNAADYAGLEPLVEQTVRLCRRKPKKLSADAGFCNEDNLKAL